MEAASIHWMSSRISNKGFSCAIPISASVACWKRYLCSISFELFPLRLISSLSRVREIVPFCSATVARDKSASPGNKTSNRSGPWFKSAWIRNAPRRLSSWDGFIMPRPFARVAVVFGPPLSWTAESSPEERSAMLGEAIDRLTEEADALAAGRRGREADPGDRSEGGCPTRCTEL